MNTHTPLMQPAPALSMVKLLDWLVQAMRHTIEPGQPKPNDALLVEAADGWDVGFVGRLELIETDVEPCIRATFAKPRNEGTTTRDFDPVAIAMLLALSMPGGRLVLEPHGPKGDFYYLRLYIAGKRENGQRRRVYALRIPADTPPDRKTKEPKNFRSVLRQDLGIFFKDAVSEGIATQYGIETAMRDSVDRWRELYDQSPAAPPLALDADAFRNFLVVFHCLLGTVPLGRDHAA